MDKTKHGFSLIELVIAILIVGIITGIAAPIYSSHMRKVRRIEAISGLTDLAARLERYYALNNTYVGATVTGVGASTTTIHNYYTLAITAAALTATTYTITATPVVGSAQASDTECGTYTLTQTGQQSISGTGTVAYCWR